MVFLLAGCTGGEEGLSSEEAQTEAENFVNEHLLGQGQENAQVGDVSEEKGMFKMDVQVGSENIESYMTKDGSTFFPQAIDMENPESQMSSEGQGSSQGQQEMDPAAQAESMVTQGKGLLEQYGSEVTEEEKQNMEGAIDELETLTEEDDAGEEELSEAMQEVQEATQPMIDQAMQEQQQQQPSEGDGEVQVQPSPQQ